LKKEEKKNFLPFVKGEGFKKIKESSFSKINLTTIKKQTKLEWFKF